MLKSLGTLEMKRSQRKRFLIGDVEDQGFGMEWLQPLAARTDSKRQGVVWG